MNPLAERPTGAAGPPHTGAAGERLMSLDALRGFDMFWIIGGYELVWGLGEGLHSEWFNRHILPQIEHRLWAGFTAWDLIMPLFLFIVGAAMPFSFAKRLERGESKGRIYLHVLYRVVVLWILGMIVQGRLLEYQLPRLHWYSNTLQTIAAGYLISSILLLNLRLRWQFVVTAALLLLYWGLLVLVPVPGQGADPFGPQDNLAVYVATHVFDFRVLGDIFVRGLSKRTGNWHDFVRAGAGITILWLLLLYMYRKRTFIKV